MEAMVNFSIAASAITAEKTVELSRAVKIQVNKKAKDIRAYKHARSVGLKPKKSAKEKIRKQLNEEIIQVFKSQKIRQLDLAISTQTSRPRITRLLNRKTQQFTIDAMIEILSTLGVNTKIKFHK